MQVITQLPPSLIERLAKTFLPPGFIDAISRLENPQRYDGLAEMLKRRNISFVGKRILDVGCRYGTSTFAASRMGAAEVVGIDISSDSIETARYLLAQLINNPTICGKAKISFQDIRPFENPPFDLESFDIVLCNALFEHVPYSERKVLAQQLWKFVSPGGFFIVNETPNRWWLKDGHTTGLWGLPYLPKSIAQRYAMLFSKQYTRAQLLDWDYMISQGIRGVTYSEIASALPQVDNQFDVQADDIQGYFDTLLRMYHTPRNKITNSFWRIICRAAEKILCQPWHLPNTIVLPDLFMALKKTG